MKRPRAEMIQLRAEVVRLRGTGLTIKEVAGHLGIPVSTAGTYALHDAADRPRDEVTPDAMLLRRAGLTHDRIAARVGVSVSTVRRALKEAGAA